MNEFDIDYHGDFPDGQKALIVSALKKALAGTVFENMTADVSVSLGPTPKSMPNVFYHGIVQGNRLSIRVLLDKTQMAVCTIPVPAVMMHDIERRVRANLNPPKSEKGRGKTGVGKNPRHPALAMDTRGPAPVLSGVNLRTKKEHHNERGSDMTRSKKQATSLKGIQGKPDLQKQVLDALLESFPAGSWFNHEQVIPVLQEIGLVDIKNPKSIGTAFSFLCSRGELEGDPRPGGSGYCRFRFPEDSEEQPGSTEGEGGADTIESLVAEIYALEEKLTPLKVKLRKLVTAEMSIHQARMSELEQVRVICQLFDEVIDGDEVGSL